MAQNTAHGCSMNKLPSESEIIALEKAVWEAFARQDIRAFQKLVAPDALMVVGGMREAGQDYAQVISQFKIPDYELDEFRFMPLGDEVALLHYTVTFAGSAQHPNFTGRYYVSSIWKKLDGKWQVVFNQDARPAGASPAA